jgi:hypothetical protein
MYLLQIKHNLAGSVNTFRKYDFFWQTNCRSVETELNVNPLYYVWHFTSTLIDKKINKNLTCFNAFYMLLCAHNLMHHFISDVLYSMYCRHFCCYIICDPFVRDNNDIIYCTSSDNLPGRHYAAS